MSTPTRTPNAATTTRPGRSSHRVARKSPLGWLPWALLGLLALLLGAVLLLVNAVDDDGPDGPAGDTLGQVGSDGSGLDGADGDGQIAGTEGGTDDSTTDDSAADDSTADDSAGSGTGDGGAASLTADGEDLLAAAGSSLADRSGQAVTGTAEVQSVVSDEGFWVGSDEASRVFVFLTPEARRSQGESGFQVTAGQTVQLEGAVTPLAETPDAAEGVTADEGLGQLEGQGGYVRADAVSLG